MSGGLSHGNQEKMEAALEMRKAEKRRSEANVKSTQESIQTEVKLQQELQLEAQKYSRELNSLQATIEYVSFLLPFRIEVFSFCKGHCFELEQVASY